MANDGAAASVNPENERELMKAIQAPAKEKAVRHADQILLVDKGQIVQRGTHEELTGQDAARRSQTKTRAELFTPEIRDQFL